MHLNELGQDLINLRNPLEALYIYIYIYIYIRHQFYCIYFSLLFDFPMK